MKLIDHFKSTMQQQFPEHDLSLNECDDNEFLDNETNAMWMMFQFCNAWHKPKKDKLIQDHEKVLAVTKEGMLRVCFKWMTDDETFNFKAWKEIPPLTTKGGE